MLHVTGGLEPSLGGPAVGILNLVAAAARQGIDSHIVAVIDDPDSPLATQLRERGAAENYHVTLVKRTGHFKGRASRWGISIPLARWLSQHSREYDIIVTHGAWMFSSLNALIFARLHGSACVLVPHESLTEFDVHKKGSSLRVVAKQFLKRIYLRYCDLIIAGSNVEAMQSMQLGAKAENLVMWYPLVDDHQPPRPRRRWSSLPTFRIGFLGRIDPKKNIDVLLRTLALLPPNFSLVVGGDGPEKLKRTLTSLAAELNVENRVEWRGFVNAAGKDEFFASIDVLAMPSQFESFGIVAVESMMRGVPVILSPTTGVAELVEKHGGGLVIPPTPESLARVFEGLSQNPVAMEAMSSQGIWVTNEYLSFTRAGSQLRDKYIEIAHAVRPQAFVTGVHRDA